MTVIFMPEKEDGAWEKLGKIVSQILELEKQREEFLKEKRPILEAGDELLGRYYEAIGALEVEEKYVEEQKKLKEMEGKIESLQHNFLTILSNITFPAPMDIMLVKKTNEGYVFPLEPPINENVIKYLAKFFGYEWPTIMENTQVFPDRIVVTEKTREVAIRRFISLTKKLRDESNAFLRASEIASSLTEKRLQILTVLRENKKPMGFADIQRSVAKKYGEKAGKIRGFFYLMLETPALIQKTEKGLYKLSSLGENVLKLKLSSTVMQPTENEAE